MYIAGFVIPVPGDNRERYEAWAAMSSALLREYGCLEVVEAWEDEVPDGTRTDFRRAVAAEPGEKIVFAWQVWPDKETLKACEAAMSTDLRFDPAERPPFASRRIVFGGFRPLHTMGR